MERSKRLLNFLLMITTTAILMFVGMVLNNQTPMVTAANAATTQDEQTIDKIMSNEKLRELVLINMKDQKIIQDPNFTLSDFTPTTFKEDLAKLTQLGWEIGTNEQVDRQEPVNGGNGSVGPANKGNYSLEGLEYCTNLTKLELNADLNRGSKFHHDDIIDVSPLEGLEKLEYINLSGNRIQDISPIAGLKNVKTLYLNNNCINNLNTLDAEQYTEGFNYLEQIVIKPLQVLHSNTYTWKAPFVDALPKNVKTEDNKPFQPYQQKFLRPGTLAYGNPTDTKYSQIDVFRNGTRGTGVAQGTTTINGDDFTYTNLAPQIIPTDPTNPWASYYPNATVVNNTYTYYMIAQYNVYPGEPLYAALSYFMPYVIQPEEAQPVTVEYVDTNGNSIHASATIKGEIDQAFDLSTADYKLNIPGYTFSKYDPAQTGKITGEKQTFKLIYTKNSTPVNPTPPTTPNPPTNPETPTFPVHPTPPSGTQLPNYAKTTGEVVYSLKKIYLYKNPTFKKAERLVGYTQKPRVFRPMFVVTGYSYSNAGRLRFKVVDVNHDSPTAGMTGYITTKSSFVSPVYYQAVPKFITVISPNGVIEYNEKDLTKPVQTFKQGRILKVESITTHNLTTRYMLGNGNFITANRKLVMNGKQKQPTRVVAKKAINRYTTANFTKKNGHYKKGAKIKVNFYTYSHDASNTKSGAKRFSVKGGYITANPKFVKVYYK